MSYDAIQTAFVLALVSLVWISIGIFIGWVIWG